MKYLFLAILAISLCSFKNWVTHSYKPSPYIKEAGTVTAQVAKKIEKETALKLIGTGGGMLGQIHSMAMSFVYYGDISMEESRELLVYCIEEYLSAINANEKIRPHLSHYPFTSHGLEITIFIQQQDGRNPPVGFLSIVGEINGKVSYEIRQPGHPSTKKIHQESYEEAKNLISQNDPEKRRIKTSTAYNLKDT